MSYTPNTWQKGDVVTSAKLNNIEQGIANAGGVLVVNATTEGQTTTLDKTWQQIYDSAFAVVIWIEEGYGNKNYDPVGSVWAEGGVYYVQTITDVTYTATSEDGYPSRTDGE